MSDLDRLRREIRDIDAGILDLVAARLDCAKKIGVFKLQNDMPVKDFRVEKSVLDANRIVAAERGLDPDLADELSRILIKHSVMVQDEFQSRQNYAREKDQKRIAVVGGAGKMGRWLADFFATFGHDVTILDHQQQLDESPRYAAAPDLNHVCQKNDVIVIATPMKAAATIIRDIADIGTSALVFDVCSLKSPVAKALAYARNKGIRVSSVHPMFGPGVKILAGRNIIICSDGNPQHADEAQALFEGTTAKLIRMDLQEHDALMSYVLGLSHLTNLVFAAMLRKSGFPFARLKSVASTTFDAQVGVAWPVVREHQDLYYEIQTENAWTEELVQLVTKELGKFERMISGRKRAAFKKMMSDSLEYMSER